MKVPLSQTEISSQYATGAVVLDAQGNAFLAFEGTQLSLLQYDASSSSWGAPLVLDPSPEQLQNIYIDVDGNKTVVWLDAVPGLGEVHHISRYMPASGWADIQPSDLDTAPTAAAGVGVVVGGHGQVGAVSYTTQRAVGIQPAFQTLEARLYDPRAGWGSWASIATQQGTFGFAADLVLASNGTAIIDWGMFEAYVPGGGWAAPSSFPPPSAPSTLLTDHAGNVAGITSQPAGGSLSGFYSGALSVESYSAGSWGSPLLAVPDPGIKNESPEAFAMGGGAILFAWFDVNTSTLHAAYFSQGTAIAADIGKLSYAMVGNPLLQVDAQGRALMVWTESIPKEEVANSPGWTRGDVWHHFYARYAPGSGWTTPVQLDGDDGLSLEAGLLAMGMNDAGQAMALWYGQGGLLAAVLP